MIARWSVLALVIVLCGQPVLGQDSSTTAPDTTEPWHEDAWTRIVQRDGLAISYIFYSEADNRNDGVVLRLRNENDYPVRYTFTVIFRGPEAEATAQVQGSLKPGEMQTGEKSGLYWVPFEDRRAIGQLGVRGIEVTRVRPN